MSRRPKTLNVCHSDAKHAYAFVSFWNHPYLIQLAYIQPNWYNIRHSSYSKEGGLLRIKVERFI